MGTSFVELNHLRNEVCIFESALNLPAEATGCLGCRAGTASQQRTSESYSFARLPKTTTEDLDTASCNITMHIIERGRQWLIHHDATSDRIIHRDKVLGTAKGTMMMMAYYEEWKPPGQHC